MEVVAKYILYFFIYSFLGWFMEVCVSLWNKKRFINRGFLIGPICPIYGHGILAIIILIGSNTNDFLAVFLKSILICSILEYFTSYFMEKLFNIRWWDYSSKKFNINGRICLETMLPFGILSSLVIYGIHPLVITLVDKLSINVIYVLAIILVIIYVIDNIVSLFILLNIKDKIKSERKDNTEKVKKYVEKWIEKNSYLYRRLHSSFPKFQVHLKRIKKKIK